MLIAFNAAPGTIASTAEGAYGPYAKALAEMMREGGLLLNDVFERVRLRVSDATQGAQVPWHASNVTDSFVFFERTADAPPSVAANEVSPTLRSRPIRELIPLPAAARNRRDKLGHVVLTQARGFVDEVAKRPAQCLVIEVSGANNVEACGF
jgi:hypothetical protein